MKTVKTRVRLLMPPTWFVLRWRWVSTGSCVPEPRPLTRGSLAAVRRDIQPAGPRTVIKYARTQNADDRLAHWVEVTAKRNPLGCSQIKMRAFKVQERPLVVSSSRIKDPGYGLHSTSSVLTQSPISDNRVCFPGPQFVYLEGKMHPGIISRASLALTSWDVMDDKSTRTVWRDQD